MTEGSDVNDFLERIRELGERRDKEDEERTKKLEEEILQGRKERQARRAERARSLALTDDSPTLNVARLSASSISPSSINPPEHLEPTPQQETPTLTPDVEEKPGTTESTERHGSIQDPLDSPRAAPPVSRSRAGTLSWQQRPSSRDFGSSTASPTRSPTRASHLRNLSTASDENRLSRSFGFARPKDSSPQSPERSLGSPYRRREERSDSVTEPSAPQLLPPSLDHEPNAEVEKPELERSLSIPRTVSRDSNTGHRFSVSSVSGLGSPVHLSEAQKLEPPQADSSLEEPLPESPTQRRMSPERTRSTSPTKGLGGFVQSAMMRRSDSVSKRWSAQIPQGISRSNSIVSNRSSVAGPNLSEMVPPSTREVGRETATFHQRPGSSHSEAATERTERPTTPSGPSPAFSDRDGVRAEGSPSRPNRPLHSRSASSVTTDGTDSAFVSRTMDPRRWSPSKATWLESALNRPESPRSTRPPSQPSWARDRQSRGSVDMGRVSNFKEVTPIGLMRTPPPGLQFKRPSVSGLSLPESPGNKSKETAPESPSVLSTPVASKMQETIPESPSPLEFFETKADEVPESASVLETSDTSIVNETAPRSPSADSPGPTKSREAIPEPPSSAEKVSATPVKETAEQLKPVAFTEERSEPQEWETEALTDSAETEAAPRPESTPTRRPPPSSLSPRPNFSISTSTREPTSPKPKPPQSPVVDFRANLRKREVVKDSGPEKEPEFKNIFGRLKKTETRNYVAPDELKGNILRGKAALNSTGGPMKTQRVDDFKDSLVKRKDEMKAGGGSIRRNTAGEKDAPPKPADAVPEAIAVRQSMTRPKSIKRISADEPISPSQSIGSSRTSQGRQSFSPFPTSPAKDISSSRTSQERPPWPLSPANDDPAWPLKDTGVSPALQEVQPSPSFPIDDSAKETETVTTATEHLHGTPTLETMSQGQERAMMDQIEPSFGKAQDAPTEPMPPVRNLSPVPVAQATVNPAPVGKGRLAGRINPALAGLLSRGPPMTEGPKKDLPTPVSTENDSASPFAPLTHVTKGRARGPKRRLPQAAAASTPSPRDDSEVGAISYFEAIPSEAPPIPVQSSDDTSDRLSQPDSDLIPDTEFPRSGSPVTELPVNSPLQEPLEREPTLPISAASLDDTSNHFSQSDSASLPDAEDLRSVSPLATQPPVSIPLPDTDIPESEPALSMPVESSDDVLDHILHPDSASLPDAEIPRSVSLLATQFPVSIPSPDTNLDESKPTSSIPVESSDDTSNRLSQSDSGSLSDVEDLGSVSPPATQPLVSIPLPDTDIPESEPALSMPVESSDDVFDHISQPDSDLLSDTEHLPSVSPVTTQFSVNIPLQSSLVGEPEQQPQIRSLTTEFDIFPSPGSSPSLDTLPHTLDNPEGMNVSDGPPALPNPSPPTSPLPSISKSLSGQQDRVALSSSYLLETSEKENSMDIEQQPQTRSLTTEFDIFPSPGSSPSLDTLPHTLDNPENMNASDGPPVPPKSSPPTSPLPLMPKSLSGQQDRFVSSSPSPLRTSYKENRMDTPPTPPQKNDPGITASATQEHVQRTTNQPSPPVPPKQDDYMLSKPVDPRRLSRKMSAPSLVAQASEAREVIAGFFKTFPTPRDRMDIDPQLMLMKKPEESKIRTLRMQIWELTGDGRRQELPSHQEYILYQGSMYLCVHVFEARGSNNSEVYLWCGDDVPDVSVDSEQMFARKVARENSSKLQVIRQGKEPVRFIQALGGIMITRRGSSSRHNSSALYMLCGRKHLGQMTFDEIDYSLRNLCSGFPYVVSAPFGKLYLWKGKGSGPEETGAARLIGMDLGLTGEFEEVAEGEEPEDFFDVFAGPREAAPYMCQNYWQLKPKHSQFRIRLLRVDHELGQPTRFWNLRRPGSGSPVVRPNDCVQEIEPFCYRDLNDKDIYVLDTFFEIYVIIGEQATQKSADFTSAVVFAHEYGLLATSLQDRPFIPKSYVTLGGVADRCQSAFRKWNPRTLNAPFVFPLDVVIEAMRAIGE